MRTLAEIAATPMSGIESSEPLRVAAETPLSAVVDLLREHAHAAVLVEEAGVLVGIFTERDLMARVDHGAPAWQQRPVREVMTKTPTTIRSDQTLEDALNRMLVGVYRHLPVVSAEGATIGMVSILDLLVHISECFPEEFVNLPPGPEHEASGRWGG